MTTFDAVNGNRGAGMPTAKELDPSESLSALFGAKLRKLRHGAGLTQRQLGAMIPIAHSMIARFELGTETPTQQVVEALDRLLAADGDLVDLWLHVVRTPIPDWARKYIHLEPQAHKIQTYSGHTVHGLLQTPGYARALLGNAVPGVGKRLEGLLTARLARQGVLRRPDDPTKLWAIIDEAVLRRPVGGPVVMREQLGHLLAVSAELENVTLQVLPFEQGAPAVMSGALTVLSFLDRQPVAYLENSQSGELVEHARRVSEYALAFDHLLAQALSPEASIRLIRSAMEDHRDPRIPTRPQRRRLAQVQPQQRAGRGVRRGR
ncbi:helix-turn-helix domain-containing protein [Streptomyces somaliensis]|uniref:helix-turn-helix domain-containing protein n=1 Tax=Streptomyces somaliensis TaxID=78355 RepID=UPI0020CDD482|nr:helix-turn-helix transcriptional regulator [Streptomyces somaliensis]MCP9944886.1 helix-turn-helix domain-containing protein [Streptomyces somaliensis]MCP9961890.1 helix-turn-helix domain-containing protein [Streptomyces somaliensis]MCP9974711.1 helix-turn-helix domain-containing protein [Streptomyces somaliensis]